MSKLFTKQKSVRITGPVRGSVRVVLGLILYALAGLPVLGQVLIPYQSTWKYAPEGTTPAANWPTAGFSDAAWLSGQGAFGFGAHAYNTLLQRGPGNAPPNYPVFYFRKAVSIPSAAAYPSYRLRAFLDDGAVIYVNGVEVARKNVNPSNPNFPYTGAAGDSLVIDTLLNASLFQNGTNLIAAAVHQTGSTSSDILFDLQLEGQTSQVSLTRYPYLQLPGHDRMSIWWYTNLPSNSTVRYSVNSDMSGAIEVPMATVDTLHKVSLTGLQPNTKYYYLVGHGTGSGFVPLQNNPMATNFRTQPVPGNTTQTMRFWLLGDSGAGQDSINNQRPYKVRDAYLHYLNDQGNPNVNAILFLGDNSNTQGYEGWQRALDLTLFKFYNRPNDKQLLSRIPSWTVLGNHDYDPDSNYVHTDGITYFIKKAYYAQTAASFSTFAFPENGEIGGQPTLNKKGYYSFDQGDVHFVVLNPYLFESDNKNDRQVHPINDIHEIFSDKSISWNKNATISIEDFPQVIWLRNDLMNNTKKWTVVTFHQPPFTTMGHFEEDFDLARIRNKLLPILEEPQYRVDMVLVSHSHAYLRGGMVRKNGAQPRTTDFTQSGNLGRYPASSPYIKSNNEAAYSYLLTGSAGRGAPGDGDVYAKLRHPGSSELPLDNLTGNSDTDFYHLKGGSVELVFRENRLDVKFIREKDSAPGYSVDDQYVVMKGVNNTTPINSSPGTQVTLRASWVGEYKWYSTPDTLQEILSASGNREFKPSPNTNTTYYAKDGHGHLRDVFIVNVAGVVQSVQTGDWHNTATWDCACIPTSSYTVQINATHTVTVSTGDALLKTLVKNGGTLNLMNGRKLCFSCP